MARRRSGAHRRRGRGLGLGEETRLDELQSVADNAVLTVRLRAHDALPPAVLQALTGRHVQVITV